MPRGCQGVALVSVQLAAAPPVDLYFATQDGCEAFRAAHPTYTKPGEVCVAVKNTSVPAAPTNCDRQRRVEYAPLEQRGICWR